MGKVIAGMSMSLDGYIDDHNGSVEKLYSDFAELHDVPTFQEMIKNTGAVVMGRHVYEMADPFLWANDDYEFQTPIFVLTHTPPAKYPKGNDRLTFTFVTDGVESAISQAKKAAGKKDVQVIGANTIQGCFS
jgi:dihydrofolate reductase